VWIVIAIPTFAKSLFRSSLLSGVRVIVGVAREHLITHYIPTGAEWLGPEAEIEGQQEKAFWIEAERLRPEFHCKKYGLPPRLLSFEPRQDRIAA
jgi:hypothetical protein